MAGPWDVWRSAYGIEDPGVIWEKVSLPHCFNASDAVDPDVKYYQGQGWYRTWLEIDPPFEGGRILLHFLGAGQRTDVFVFTEHVGSHSGGYDEFHIDITEAAERAGRDPRHQGKVPIAVCCDNSRDLDLIPSDLSDFNLYGGLYRPVSLVYVPEVSIERLRIDADASGTLRVAAALRRPVDFDGEFELHVRITGPTGDEVTEHSMTTGPWVGEQPIFGQTLLSPRLWSPDSPELYTATVTLRSSGGETSMSERFGFRSFEFVKQGPFKLNGERLLLRGTHRHEDHAGFGAAMPEDLIQREMELMKSMGVNFIRLGHYQQHRRVLELCDELGILVWEEIPWCRGGVRGEPYQAIARRMFRNMVEQHRNHPSVIIWGLGNENDWPGDTEQFDKSRIREFMRELHLLAHALDPERKTAIRRCQFCMDIPDVYSPSIWAGWYRGRFTDYRTASENNQSKVDHCLHVEWGADNHAGRHAEHPYALLRSVSSSDTADERVGDYLMAGGDARASRDGDWSETYCCDLIDWHLKEQETMDSLAGAAYWPFKDFSTPVRPENPVPYVNQKGVVQRDLTPKEAYYVFQSYWTERPMVRIYSHSWPVRWGGADEKKLVKVYSNCPEAELFLNGLSQGKKQRDSQNFPAAGLRWEVVFEAGKNRLEVVGWKDGTEVRDEIALEYETRKWESPTAIELREINRHENFVTVEAVARDRHGVPCCDAAMFVHFGLSGAGRLLDNLGIPSGSRRVQVGNGRARISLEAGGKCVLSCHAEGMEAGFLTVE